MGDRAAILSSYHKMKIKKKIVKKMIYEKLRGKSGEPLLW